MHTCPLRSVSLRFATFGAHGRVHACFATHARSILTRGYSCPLKPQIGYIIFYQGAAATHCFCSPAGRFGLIGLSQFLPLFRRLCPPFLSFVPCAPHSLRLILRLRSFVSHRTRFHSRARAFFRSFVSFRSFCR